MLRMFTLKSGILHQRFYEGETLILMFGQGLWFGDRMQRSLINPNQCRAFGIKICDDPTDPHRDLGIELDDNNFIPMADGLFDGILYGKILGIFDGI